MAPITRSMAKKHGSPSTIWSPLQRSPRPMQRSPGPKTPIGFPIRPEPCAILKGHMRRQRIKTSVLDRENCALRCENQCLRKKMIQLGSTLNEMVRKNKNLQLECLFWKDRCTLQEEQAQSLLNQKKCLLECQKILEEKYTKLKGYNRNLIQQKYDIIQQNRQLQSAMEVFQNEDDAEFVIPIEQIIFVDEENENQEQQEEEIRDVQ